MKASEIISRIEKQIDIESKKIESHMIRRTLLDDILHMAKKDGYIEKKGNVLLESLKERKDVKL